MRAVAEGRIPADSHAFRLHLDRCLGCRACEPVCPSGVEYGFLLERGREAIAMARGIPRLERLMLAVFGNRVLNEVAGFLARLSRDTRLAALAVRVLPARFRRTRMAAAMLEASLPWKPPRAAAASADGPGAMPTGGAESAGFESAPSVAGRRPTVGPARRQRIVVFEGCVQKTLFGRVNDATRSVMRYNGHSVVKVRRLGCCGALHAHAGALDAARELARRNLRALEPHLGHSDHFAGTDRLTGSGATAGAETDASDDGGRDGRGPDAIIVNAAGCAAMMKDYGRLFEGRPEQAVAETVSRRVQDPLVFLARHGVRAGRPLEMRAAWDSPCHLVHGQRSGDAPLDALRAAVPDLDVVPVPNAEECCGGAGIHSLVHSERGDRILADKLSAIRSVSPAVVLTANPGCIMQIGGGLAIAGEHLRAIHPVELIATRCAHSDIGEVG